MGALFNIIVYSIENLILGVLLTVVGVAFMFFIIRSWYSNRAFYFCQLCGGSGSVFLFVVSGYFVGWCGHYMLICR